MIRDQEGIENCLPRQNCEQNDRQERGTSFKWAINTKGLIRWI